MKFKVLLVIPSRYGSTRLPGKPLKKIGEKTLIQRVYERAKKINCQKTIVATDDKKILDHCKTNKIECIMTKKNHLTGTDRISEVSKKYNFKWVLNIQGDEPLLNNKHNEIIISTRKKITRNSKDNCYFKHIGVYLYQKKFLEKFSKLKERFLEKDQNLEHLRIIENGYKIIALRAKHLTTGVDTIKDLLEVRKFYK